MTQIAPFFLMGFLLITAVSGLKGAYSPDLKAYLCHYRPYPDDYWGDYGGYYPDNYRGHRGRYHPDDYDWRGGYRPGPESGAEFLKTLIIGALIAFIFLKVL